MADHDDMAAVCSLCGTSPDPVTEGDPPLGWSAELEPARGAEGTGATGEGPRTNRWVCGTCTRRHVRSIEAKLDPEWW